jgi:amino acid adenylation domain-containing protein
LIPFRKQEIDGDIGRRFRLVARHVPDNPAIRTSEEAVSYAELDGASDRIARLLLSKQGGTAEPVALLAAEGIEGWAALLGILKSGKSVVLLSPDFEIPRLTAIWEDAGRPPILTNRSHRPLAESFASSGPVLDLNENPPASAGLPEPHPGPDTLAVISYTSGSTGEPKGVMWSHRFALHTSRYNHDRYRLSETDRFAFLSAYGFSAALIQSFAALLSGTTLCLGSGRFHELRSLVAWLSREGMTILHLTSFGLLRQQAEGMTERADLPALRTILLSGEELYRRELERFRAFFPAGVEFSYRFAGSEALMMTELRIPPGARITDEKVPAGFIVPDKELLLLDPDGSPVPPGEAGEIAVRSRYLADGYWRQEELTRSKFLPDPEGARRRIFLTGDMGRLLPDGSLLYTGRKDNIVRVRGFNIQLEAVESALRRLPGILEAAATSHSIGGGDKRLVAYLVSGAGGTASVREIRNELIARLPAYMIPTMYVFVDALPRTPMDRVDHAALPPPAGGRPNLGTPCVEGRDETERRLCALWSELIGVDPVGVEDDFFLLGGDSLLSVNMVLRAEEMFGRQVPSDFFHHPTISHLSQLWRAVSDASPKQLPVEEETFPLRGKAAFAGENDSDPGKKTKFRKRFQSPAAVVGPYSLRLRLRIPRLAAETLTMQFGFRAGCRWLAWWCRQGELTRLFYPAEMKLFERWVASLGGCPDAPAGASAANRIGNILWSMRFKRSIPLRTGDSFLASLRLSSARFHRDLARVIDAAPPETFGRIFPVEGIEPVEQAIRERRGVILVTYHGVANRFAVAALPRRWGGPPIPTLSLTQALRLKRKEGSVRAMAIGEAALLANIALEGHRLLQQGGILQVIPDIGYDATDGLPLVIGGYRFLVKPGFAELAILADAVVIPYYATRRIDGGIHTRFFPPFTRLPRDRDRKAQVDHLLGQYAGFVHRSWKLAPESLMWQVIATHLTRPTDAG